MSDLNHAGATEADDELYGWEDIVLDRIEAGVCAMCGNPFRGSGEICPACDLLTLPFNDALDIHSESLLWDGD